MIGYLYIFLTILFTVTGQLLIKWRMSMPAKALPAGIFDKVTHLFQVFLDPWVIMGFGSAFVASLAWMAAMTKFEISFAYPFMSLSFVLVLFFSGVFFGEPISIGKVLGLVIIVFGLVVSVKF